MRSPYDNNGANVFWPHRNRAENSELVLGKTWSPGTWTAGGSLFIQNVVRPDFGQDENAHYCSSGLIESVLDGGRSGVINLDVGVHKVGGEHQAKASVVGMRVFANANKASHTKGIVTGLWPMVRSYLERLGGAICTAMEINAFTEFAWDPDDSTHYIKDPFLNGGKTPVVSCLINNYQSFSKNLGKGKAQNAFGIALTSLGPQGREPGYQTGVYLSDCSQESIRINLWGVNYGLKFEGRSKKAALDMGPNKINFGGFPGILTEQGDVAYNNVSNRMFLFGKNGLTEIVKTKGVFNGRLMLEIGNEIYYVNLEKA